MRIFDTVAIVGTGLIGGSLGLEIRSRRLARKVIGISRREKNVLLAKKIGAIDEAHTRLTALSEADAVVLAAPVDAILRLGQELSGCLDSRTLVTDVGSTKGNIVSSLSKLFPRFVGGHPLAGSEKKSIAWARKGLFKDSKCILTPIGSTDRQALAKVRLLWKSVGARVILMSPKEHDTTLSFISHLPHAAAFSLMNAIPQKYLKFAAAGLKDTARVASSDARLWADIFMDNRADLLKALESLGGQLHNVSDALKRSDLKKLCCLLAEARRRREGLG